MSTILKALRRLEEEKRSSEERPLREEVATGQPVSDAARGPSRLPWLVGLALLLAVGLGVWSQWPLGGGGGEEPVDVAAQPVAEPTPPAPRTVPSAPPQPVVREAPRPAPPTEAPETPAQPEQAFASEVEVVARPAASPRSPIEMSPAAEAGAEASEPEPAPPAPRRSERSAPEPDAPAVVAKVEASAPPAPSPPAPVAERSAPEPEPASSWRAESPPPPAPAEETSTGGDLSVERTLWHPRAERRAAFVALGGEPAARVEEGDVLGRYVVSEIQPTGVVFLRDGKPVERKVGSR